MSIIHSSEFIDQHKQVLVDYYSAVLTDHENHARSIQEDWNRADLIELARSSWNHLTDQQRGLIALLCNELC